MTNDLIVYSGRSAGIDLGHPANATCHRGPDSGIHGCRGDQPDSMVIYSTGLDSHLLQ